MTPALAAAIHAVIDDLANHPAVLVRGPVERLCAAMELRPTEVAGAFLDRHGRLVPCQCAACVCIRAKHDERQRILAGIEGLLKPESVV